MKTNFELNHNNYEVNNSDMFNTAGLAKKSTVLAIAPETNLEDSLPTCGNLICRSYTIY